MLVGVIAFSFAMGSLSAIISNYDQIEAILKEKIATLNEIHAKHKLTPGLYDEIRKIIRYDHSRRLNDY